MSDLKEIAHRYARALEQNDTSSLEEWVHPDIIQHNEFIPQGIAGVKHVLESWGSAFSDRKVTVDDVIVGGDRLVGRYTFEGTHDGSFLGVKPTGNRIKTTSIEIWRVEDGRLVEHWNEISSAELFDQIGGRPGGPPKD